ncbi:hypothetical protein GCM10009127_18020 [Alteraurantiacibacter aestuarii]|uniref:M56 family metallopeptidase n=1 Tax=Alteraurantiacibacter aestuarii TaxID=650004 RepID=UPI0031D7707B
MTDWLIDTLVSTGVLIAAILLLRRPVSRHFGPQVAYALWALPLLRFLLPPIVLPASMAPPEAPAVAEPVVVLLSATPEVASSQMIEPAYTAGIELADFLLPIWLGGAAIFLLWRARDYLLMRRYLLADARPVGEAGKVRLVETPAVSSPVAFGVSDKVVALPPQFMAHPDLSARDLAIAHELAHHRGYDLVANIAAQPLLALHWFNPLAWWGWRAMRRDQEAACDARVVAGKQRSERAAYAEVIAGFAAGPHLALAAPMACPVLGEKSIIHRLRSLTMSDIPSGRKKLGIIAIATTALAVLPLTASISYARNEAPDAPLPPVPPVAPLAPLAPEAPVAQVAPAPPSIESIDPDQPHRVIIRRIGDNHEFSESEFIDEQEMERMFAEIEASMAELDGLDAHIQTAMVGAQRAMEESRRSLEIARTKVPQIEMACDGDQIVSHRQGANGRQMMIICQTAALRQAQRAIAQNPGLSQEQRENILDALEDELDDLEDLEVSFVPKPVLRVQVRNSVSPSKVMAPAPVVRTTAAQIRIWAPVAEDAEDLDDCEEEDGGYTA